MYIPSNTRYETEALIAKLVLPERTNHKAELVRMLIDNKKARDYYLRLAELLGSTLGKEREAEMFWHTAAFANCIVDWKKELDFNEWVKTGFKVNATREEQDRAINGWRFKQLVLYMLSLYTLDEAIINRHKEMLLAPYAQKEPQEILYPSSTGTFCSLPVLGSQAFYASGNLVVSGIGEVYTAYTPFTKAWGTYKNEAWQEEVGETTAFQLWVANILVMGKNKDVYRCLKRAKGV